jgi:hypothetical protein
MFVRHLSRSNVTFSISTAVTRFESEHRLATAVSCQLTYPDLTRELVQAENRN